MCSNYQKTVAFEVYGKTYDKLSMNDRCKINEYIIKYGYVNVLKHPERIRDNFKEILRGKK